MSAIEPVTVIAQLFVTNQENQEQCQRLAECVHTLLQTLESLQRQDHLTRPSDELQDRLSTLQETLEDAKAFMSKQESRNKLMKFLCACKIQGQLQEFHVRLSDQHKQLTLLLQVEQRGAVDAVQESVDAVQDSVDAVQESVDAVQDSVDAVQDSVDAVQEGMDAVQDSVDAVQESVEEGNTIINKKLDEVQEGVDRLLKDRQARVAGPSTPTQPAQRPDGRSPTESQQALKKQLSEKFHNVRAVIPRQGEAASLEEIYTELYITEGECKEVSTEHEVRQIEMSSKIKTAKRETAIKHTDIFKPLPGKNKRIRVVMTKGVAGIGKTVSVQKFILDWAEGRANQDIHFLFPVPFREINGIKEKKYTLKELIYHFFSEISDLIFSTDEKYNIAFIFDGLDESRLPLDFENYEDIRNVSASATVDVLLTNLIKGNLLPSAQIWITSRPAAANQIPSEYVDQVTEVRGFTDPQKEKYFKKNINDQEMASRIITHLKRSRSLYIMCHIPVFCWMAATVLVSILTKGKTDENPASLTQMYIHFLIIQAKHISKKYGDIWNRKTVLSLGRLAFQQLEKGNLIFYEKDLKDCGMDAEEASDYSGVCTQIFREESGLYQQKVFCFVHLSIQEFLAALYVFLCFSNRGRNMSDQQQISELSALFRAATLHDLHKTAMDLALQSNNGHLDLFLRFLLGLSLESNQIYLQDLLSQTSSQSQNSVNTVQYVKKKIRGERISERGINLFYCLNELNQHAVVEHIDRKEGQLSVEMLLPGQWRTVTFRLEMSEEHLDVFDLQKYLKTPEKDQTDLLSPDDVLQKLVPVVTTSTRAV